MRKLLVVLGVAVALMGCESQNKPERFQARAEHNHDHHHGHDGEHLTLGTATTAGVTYEAIQIGHPEGSELVVEIVLAEDSPRPSTARVWVGTETAEGSVKTRAEGSGPLFDVHVELPDPLSEDARLWVEIENASGETAASSFELKR